MGLKPLMNCDPWVNPTTIYYQAAKAEQEGRKRWSALHGKQLGHDLSNPPAHRKNSFMSWMVDISDEAIDEDLRSRQKACQKNLGCVVNQKAEYTSALRSMRESLVQALQQVEGDLQTTEPRT